MFSSCAKYYDMRREHISNKIERKTVKAMYWAQAHPKDSVGAAKRLKKINLLILKYNRIPEPDSIW
jgi:hypothetical protein